MRARRSCSNNRLEQVEGRKPKGVVDLGTPILKFVVGKTRWPNRAGCPKRLRPIPAEEQVAQCFRATVRGVASSSSIGATAPGYQR